VDTALTHLSTDSQLDDGGGVLSEEVLSALEMNTLPDSTDCFISLHAIAST
jgi:hypothetical protein